MQSHKLIILNLRCHLTGLSQQKRRSTFLTKREKQVIFDIQKSTNLQEPQNKNNHDDEDITPFTGWDKNIKHEYQRLILEALITDQKCRSKRSWINRGFYCILLIQLVNGSRIGEAVGCALKYADNGKREQRVQVEKRRDKYLRLMIIPNAILDHYSVDQIREQLKAMGQTYRNLTDAAIQFCRRHLGYNSHAHRYAFVGMMSNKAGCTPQMIAKLTGHATMEHILHYTQRKIAEDALRQAVR